MVRTNPRNVVCPPRPRHFIVHLELFRSRKLTRCSLALCVSRSWISPTGTFDHVLADTKYVPTEAVRFTPILAANNEPRSVSSASTISRTT